MSARGQLHIKGLIGQGGFGKVFLVENDAHEKFALKEIQLAGRSHKEIMQTIQEVKLLAALNHEHILRYVQCIEGGGKVMILTEFCPNGDLGEYVEAHAGTAMDERRLVEWIRQITSSLKYLHNLPTPIIHRDLKLANIFLDANWDCKLGDFGIARVLTSAAELAATKCGTLPYMSPELFNDIPYSDRTDIFSLGIMMYEMAHMDKEGILPQVMLFKIVHLQIPSMPTSYSSGVTDLLTMMLQNDPDDRPSAAQILELSVFKTTKKPPPITDRPKTTVLDDLDEEDEDDEAIKTLLGTVTQLKTQQGKPTHGGGAASMMREREGKAQPHPPEEEFSDNPVMTLVHRTLVGMGKTGKLRGRSVLEKQVEMLKMYCLHCLDDNASLFKRACDALDTSHDEDEIEETLIRILGHEKYGLCGVQLLHYKNYTFNMRS